MTGTRETFMDLFDDDDTLTYEPASTAALILTAGDEEAEKAALEVTKCPLTETTPYWHFALRLRSLCCLMSRVRPDCYFRSVETCFVSGILWKGVVASP